MADAESPGLDVLVHPLTDNSYDDHSRYAVWLGTPVALKLNLTPEGTVCPGGVTVMDTMVASVTSSVVEAVKEPSVAVMVVVPGA